MSSWANYWTPPVTASWLLLFFLFTPYQQPARQTDKSWLLHCHGNLHTLSPRFSGSELPARRSRRLSNRSILKQATKQSDLWSWRSSGDKQVEGELEVGVYVKQLKVLLHAATANRLQQTSLIYCLVKIPALEQTVEWKIRFLYGLKNRMKLSLLNDLSREALRKLESTQVTALIFSLIQIPILVSTLVVFLRP